MCMKFVFFVDNKDFTDKLNRCYRTNKLLVYKRDFEFTGGLEGGMGFGIHSFTL